MTAEDMEFYLKAVKRLKRMDIADPTWQIAALEKEIDYYRDKIKALKNESEMFKKPFFKSIKQLTITLDETKIREIVKSELERIEIDIAAVRRNAIREVAEKLKKFICLEEDEGSDFREDMYYKIVSLEKEMTEDKENDPE